MDMGDSIGVIQTANFREDAISRLRDVPGDQRLCIGNRARRRRAVGGAELGSGVGELAELGQDDAQIRGPG